MSGQRFLTALANAPADVYDTILAEAFDPAAVVDIAPSVSSVTVLAAATVAAGRS